MHIIMILLGVLGAIGFWRFRIGQAARGAEEAIDIAKTVANLPRRLSFSRKAGKTGLSLVEHPIDAAAILLIELARADGDMTQQHRHLILQLLETELELDTQEAEETIVNAAWITRDVPPPDVIFGKMTNLIVKSQVITVKELKALDQMLIKVGELDGAISNAQQDLLDIYRAKSAI
ncbi:MAG: TerB family tellurite resistance protein [Pseudomonadota bacterium]